TVAPPRPRPGGGGGRASPPRMRPGGSRDTNACRPTRPPMVVAASRARLCRNISAFTSTLLRGEPAVLFVDPQQREDRAGQDVRGRQAHEVVPAPAPPQPTARAITAASSSMQILKFFL